MREAGWSRDRNLDGSLAVYAYTGEGEGFGFRRRRLLRLLLDQLFVRNVRAARTRPDVILALGRNEVVFVAQLAAHVTRVGICNKIWQIELVEEILVRQANGLVRLKSSFDGRVERVEVLHHELFRAEEALARPSLVAVFAAGLVKSQREVFVRVHHGSHQRSDLFFMSR